MLDSVRLRCDHCGKDSHHSVPYIEGQIKAMKIHKAAEVAQQMQEKRGPFYDKWLASMEARGEEKRCSDCMSHHVGEHTFPENYCSFKLKVVHPAWFACPNITYWDG